MPLSDLQIRDPQFAQRVQDNFARQAAMQTVGATLADVSPGRVVIEMGWGAHLAQQNGYVHGGLLGTPLDSACGYAAMTLIPADAGVLTIEYKVNFLAPAKGDRFRFVGEVIKPGRTIIITEAQAFALVDGEEKLVAKMISTVMSVADRGDVAR